MFGLSEKFFRIIFYIHVLWLIAICQMIAQRTDSLTNPSWYIEKSKMLPYSEIDSSIHLAKKAITYSSLDDHEMQFRARDLLTTLYLEKGEIDSSLIQAYKGLEIAQNSSNDTLLASSYNILEAVYFEMQEFEKSKEYADKLLQLAMDENLDNYLFEAYWALGMIHSQWFIDSLIRPGEREEHYRQARNYYQEALSQTNVDRLDSIDILSSLGILEADKGNYDNAISHMEKVASHYEEIGSVVGMANTHNNLGYTFFEMGEIQKALQHLNKAWNLVNDLPLWIEREYISESLQEVHEYAGNTDQAYYYLKQNKRAGGQLSSNRLEADLELIESEYQNRMLEIENAKHAQQLENQYLVIILSLILLFSLIIILGILYYAKKRQDSLIQTIQKNNDELQSLNQFKDQMLSVISHDFRGPLNNLQIAISLARDEDLSVEEYKEILRGVDGQLASTQIFLQNILYWAKNQIKGYKVSKSEFNLYDLIEESEELLSQQAKEKNLIIKKDIDAQTSLFSDREIINIAFRNIFQNAIKFSREGETIAIRYYTKNGSKIISVIDSGVGMDKEVIDRLFTYQLDSAAGTQLEKGAGIGLLLSKELLELINGRIEVFSVKKQGSEFQIILS